MPTNLPPFLASEIPDLPPDSCRFHVIPAPYEKSVSYGSGTAQGPAAILQASEQLEAFDGVDCPCRHGIHTQQPATSLEAIETACRETLKHHHIPVMLGGEHTISVGAFRALAKLPEPVGIIQFDAHADLRAAYEGSPLSHACVMHHALELNIPFIQLGVRALSPPEVQLRKQHDILHYDGYDIGRNGLPTDWIPADFPQRVYVTIDIDALDTAIMPATGTPEPGGLTWWQLDHLLRDITAQRQVIGFDCVELAPIPNLHAADFTAARLIYNFMGMINRSPHAAFLSFQPLTT